MIKEMSVRDMENIESKVMAELPDFKGKKVEKGTTRGQYLIDFNDEKRDDYAKMINGINGSGVKLMFYAEEKKAKIHNNNYGFSKKNMEKVIVAYAPTAENAKRVENIVSIGVWVNPVEMHSDNYDKHKDNYVKIMKDLVSLTK